MSVRHAAPRRRPLVAPALALLLGSAVLFAQAQPPPPYRDASRPIEARVADLVGRMTLEEKFWQLFMIPGSLDDPDDDYSNGIFGLQIGTSPSSPGASAAEIARAHAERINAIQRYFVEDTRLGIPIIPFDEAVQWAWRSSRRSSGPAW